MSNRTPGATLLEYQDFIQKTLATAQTLIQDAQKALDQLVLIHMNQQSPIWKEMGGNAPEQEPVASTPVVNTPPEVTGLGVYDRNAGIPVPEAEEAAPEVSPALKEVVQSADTPEKQEYVIDSLMSLMKLTREEAEKVVASAKAGKGTKEYEARQKAAELLIPIDEWLPHFIGTPSVPAKFLAGSIYEGGKGPIAPNYKQESRVLHQYSNDLTAGVPEEIVHKWPDGFYRNKRDRTLQFKITVGSLAFCIPGFKGEMPFIIASEGPYKNVRTPINTMNFPDLKILYEDLEKSFWNWIR